MFAELPSSYSIRRWLGKVNIKVKSYRPRLPLEIHNRRYDDIEFIIACSDYGQVPHDRDVDFESDFVCQAFGRRDDRTMYFLA